MAQDKLKLEQDVTGKDGEETVTKKKDVARLLKVRYWNVELCLIFIGLTGRQPWAWS